MLNLLPSEQISELRKENKLKIILVLELVVLSIFISQILLFFLINNYITADLDIQKIYSKEKEEELKAPAFKELENKINLSSSVLSKLDSFYKSQVKTAAILEKISATLPKDAYLTSLNLNPSSLQVSLAGFAPDREDVLELRENLEKEKDFSNIYFPPENWVNRYDINFNVFFKAK